MDPEIFLLSVASLGWPLALWRLAATLIVSLGAGLMTHLALRAGWLGEQILRQPGAESSLTLRRAVGWTKETVNEAILSVRSRLAPVPAACCGSVALAAAADLVAERPEALARSGSACSESCASGNAEGVAPSGEAPVGFYRRLLRESAAATWMLGKFMALAFLLTALLELYVPQEWIIALLGEGNRFSVLTASLVGVPAYTSNLAALPLVSGLMAQGMSASAALAFLVAGPMTTIPAMAAVWGLVSRRVFGLYVGFALVGAVAFGFIHQLLT
jgi:uncharacterized membrane protein YraQ (UPF0718 family)